MSGTHINVTAVLPSCCSAGPSERPKKKKEKKYRRVNIYEFKGEGFPRQSSGEIYPTASSKLNERTQNKLEQTPTN